MNDRADSLLTFDLRAFARDYSGTPFGSRCKTAADELDRLYEIERLYSALTAHPTRPTPEDAASGTGREGGRLAVVTVDRPFHVEMQTAQYQNCPPEEPSE